MVSTSFARADILPEPALPDVAVLVAESRELAGSVQVGPCAFLSEYGVGSEAEYKRRRLAEGSIMLHAQVGYRDAEKTRRACAEIYETLAAAGHRIDRYGLIFDRNMGYPPHLRARMPRGTGLIVERQEELAAITAAAPVAPHFGDFMIGLPASLENTAAALAAGATSLGNLAQYYSFDLLYGDEDEVQRTEATVRAIALCAAQPVEVLIHSNIEDGFAPLFTDLACCLGMVLVERHIINDLLGATVAHCFGHTHSDPFTRFAFQRALRRVSPETGTMIYGNTVAYGPDLAANYAVLSSYLTIDVLAQRLGPTPHALTPVPVTEFSRIPEIDEIIEVHLFANRLIERLETVPPLVDLEAAEAMADRLIAGAEQFRDRLIGGFQEAGIDTANAFEMLLALRRLGGKRLEALFGPGVRDPAHIRGRRPLVKATTIAVLEKTAARFVAGVDAGTRAAIAGRGLVVCVATTDVHEWGKTLIECVLDGLGVGLVEGGVNADPAALVARARDGQADVIALGTYNGIALSYMTVLRCELGAAGLDLPVFVGGRLNQIPEGSNTSLPVDVTAELTAAGARVCCGLDDLLDGLLSLAGDRAA